MFIIFKSPAQIYNYMIKINCKNCVNNCCSNKYLWPTLLESEENSFIKYSKKVKTPYREMFVIRKIGSYCIFLNKKTMKCGIRRKRPLECKIYPFLLHFNKNSTNLRLDKRFCPHINTLKYNKKDLLSFVRKFKYGEDWIKAHRFMTKY